MDITETALARRFMTPESASLFRDSTLDKRMGQGTVAGALNEQVRFRFDKTGASSPRDWTLVPDNRLSSELLASPAGTKLEAKVKALLGSVERANATGALELNGIMLSNDEETWAAGYQLMTRDAARRGEGPALQLSIADSLAMGRSTANVASAQSLWGWVQIAPEYSRNMLTSVGAYSPAKTEKVARMGRVAEYVGPLMGHELQHRVSETDFDSYKDFRTYTPYAWLEEGTATLLAMDDARHRRSNMDAWNVTKAQHAGDVRAPDSFDTGWMPWAPKAKYRLDMGETVQANYVDSVGTIRGLVALAGADFRSNAGRERAESLLQDVDVTKVPKALATAMLHERDLRATSGRVAELARLIINSNRHGGVREVERRLDELVRA